MDSIREGLFDDHVTPGAHLRSVSGVHPDHVRTGFLRFVLGDCGELIPGNIRNAFCQTMVFCIFLIIKLSNTIVPC